MGFRLLPEVEADIDEIWFYVERESGSEEIADRVSDAIVECFSLLGQNPEIGRNRDHDLQPDARSFPVNGYVIIYRIDCNDALILRVMHGSRDIQGQFDR